ncbi:MAG: right-handed parallel beta-helix repeat-containing protein [Dehalococcoidia bacterium]|jgi:parallel beta-helix repeat protein
MPQGSEFSFGFYQDAYHPNVKPKITSYADHSDQPTTKIVGIKDPVLIYSTWENDSTGLTQSIFDYTSSADSAHFLLTNNTGVERNMTGCAIRGKLVYRLSGDNGYIHDAFVDYESIAINGEQLTEINNNFIVTLTQINNIADYTWKKNKTKKHIYNLTLIGFQSYFEPGEWYELNIGGAGQQEYIDSIVECYQLRCSCTATGEKSTAIAFREVEEDWKFDSNESARFMASGGGNTKNTSSEITIASQYYTGRATYYCDGTADQTEINNAINYLNGSSTTGMVKLLGGDFNTTAAIELKSNVTLWLDSGVRIVKNCNDYAVEAVGTSVTHIENANIRGYGTITRASGDTNSIELVHYEYVDDSEVSCIIYNSYEDGIYMSYCENMKIDKSKITSCSGKAILAIQSTYLLISALAIQSCGYGPYIICGNATDKIDRGDCESETSPMVTGETTPVVYNCTWARDDTYKYDGSYSWKLNSSGLGYCNVWLTESGVSLHGLVPGSTYTFKAKLYNRTLETRNYFRLTFFTYSPTGDKAYYSPYSSQISSWEEMALTVTIPFNATDILFGIRGESGINNCWIDDVRLLEIDSVSDGCQIIDCSVKDCAHDGIYVETNNTQIKGNVVANNGDHGIVIATGFDNMVSNNNCRDNGTIIDNGNCETTAPPAMLGEVLNTSTGCTFARSTDFIYADSYSYKLSKTATSGTAATNYLTDNASTSDMHGLLGMRSYTLSAQMYIPSSGILSTEIGLVFRDCGTGWSESLTRPTAVYDAWQEVSISKTLATTAVGATLGISIAAAASSSDYLYIDNVGLCPNGLGNEYNKNFYDNGINTIKGI